MNYLFLDASDTKTFGQVSANNSLSNITQDTSRTLGAKISIFCDELLTKANLQKQDIKLYAVCTGPGSLTGLRIAGSFLRSCAYLSNKPIIGIDLFSWAIQTLKEQNVKEKIRLLMPTLIGKAFFIDVDLNDTKILDSKISLKITPEFSDIETAMIFLLKNL